MTTRILFVCHGNICHSPAAEGVFRALVPEAVTDSAGTSDLRARQFVAQDFHRFDLILGMDASNVARIERLWPARPETPVRPFTDFAPEAGMTELPGPCCTRDFDGALDLIEQAAHGLRQALRMGTALTV